MTHAVLLGAQPSLFAEAARRKSKRRGLLPQPGAQGESLSRRLHPLSRQGAARHQRAGARQGLGPDQSRRAEQGPGQEGRGGHHRSRPDRADRQLRHHEKGLGQHMATHRLAASPETVHWGFFDAKLPPQLTIDSGDTVTITTVSGTLGYLPKPDSGLTVPPELQAIHDKVQAKIGGPHILTGPVAVRGAKAGQVLEVRIKAVELV